MECASCRYYEPGGFLEGDPNHLGVCRRFPPTIQPGLLDDAKKAWFGTSRPPYFESLVLAVSISPMVNEEHCCGEYMSDVA